MNKKVIAILPIFLLAACGSGPDDTAAGSDETAAEPQETAEAETETTDTAAAAPAGFAQCRTCHTVEKDGINGVGPNLWNVAGGSAAQKAGFSYSPAMESSGLTWDDATLDQYLKEPFKTVPGTKMAYAGLKNDEQRAEVITYLQSLKD